MKSPKRMRGVVADELLKVKEAYGDRRRTQIVNLKKGGKGRQDADGHRPAARAVRLDRRDRRWPWWRARMTTSSREHSGNDAPRWLVKASTTDTIYFVSKSGKPRRLPCTSFPKREKLTRRPDVLQSLAADRERLHWRLSLPCPPEDPNYPEETCVITATRFGMVKKSLISELPGPSAQTFTLVKVNEGDRLGWVGLTDGKKKDILLVTAQGMAIRFSEEDVRPMGLVAAGVNGIKLDDKDEVVGMEILPAEGEIFLLTCDGKAKRVEQKEFPIAGTLRQGCASLGPAEQGEAGRRRLGKANHMATIHLSKGAPKSTRLDAAAIRKRAATKGDVVVEVKPGEEVVSVNVGWMVDKFVKTSKAETVKPAAKKAEKKPAPKKAPVKKTKKVAPAKKTAKKKK